MAAEALWLASGAWGLFLGLCLLTGYVPGRSSFTSRRHEPVPYWLGIGMYGFGLFLFVGAAVMASLGIHVLKR